MKVGITPEAVTGAASRFSAARGSLDPVPLPGLAELADHGADTTRAALDEWWTSMSMGVVDDFDTLHQLVITAANTSVSRDREAAADIEASNDPFAPFRVN